MLSESKGSNANYIVLVYKFSGSENSPKIHGGIVILGYKRHRMREKWPTLRLLALSDSECASFCFFFLAYVSRIFLTTCKYFSRLLFP